MQQWGIRLIPEQEKIDLSHYPTEFLEFQFLRSTYEQSHTDELGT